MQGSGYYQRDKTIRPTLYWIVRDDYPANVSHYPVAFICCKQWRRNKLFFLTFVLCFVQFFPREQISVLNIVPPPWPVLKFRDVVRMAHNSDDSTGIIFRLILPVLYFSLISSCVIHHLLWHLFFAAQFQGQMICFHYWSLDLLVYISILL